MQIAPIPENENLRLQELYEYQILDTPEEKDFDDIVKLASEICKVPMSLITLIDMDRQWFKAKIGIEGTQTTRDEAFCAHAILDNNPLIVKDAKKDERFFDNPNVLNDPNVRFYCGFPLITPKGFKLGTLCVIDSKPRTINDFQKRALTILSQQVVDKLELRLKMNELKSVYKTLDEKNKKLEQLHQSNSKLLSIIGHDLKSPVATAITFLEVFGNEDIDVDQFKEYILAAKNNLEGLNFLMENLLQWAMLQYKQTEPTYTTINVYNAVKQEFDLISARAKIKNLELFNKVNQNLTIITDANILHFVIRNLVYNAIKFTETGNVTISAQVENGLLTCKIQDTGIGISEERLTKIFSWSNKSNTRGTQGEGGSGLGLQIVKEMVEKLNGEIKITSQLNKGTLATITLPV